MLGAEPVALPEDALALLTTATWVAQQSGGAFDFTTRREWRHDAALAQPTTARP